MRMYVITIVMSWLLLASCGSTSSKQEDEDWAFYGGNAAGNRYSNLKQINKENVRQLKVAWTYESAEPLEQGKRQREIECQPIVVHGVLYGTSPELQLFALNAETGKELWRFNPSAKARGYNSSNRGLNYWENGDDKRILYSAGSNLFAIDASTGKPVLSFGNDGKVDLHTGLGNDRYDVKDLAVTATSPGIIFKNIFVTGSTVAETGDALPGHIRAFDVLTGKLLWTFHTIPQPGDQGYDTWPKDAYKKIGGANCWAGMVLDQKRGMVYFGTGAPAVDFYGGDRAGANLFANCVIALDVETGKLKWYYQTVHHDLWDTDIPCPPNLATITKDGKTVDVVVQTTKDGLVYVLNRDDGSSLFPVEEKPVPVNGLPNERPWATQKFPVMPAPFSRQVITESDLPDSTSFPDSYRSAKARMSGLSFGTKFTPPQLNGNLFIGISGGAEWGGNAIDPDGILYQNGSDMPWQLKMVDLQTSIKAATSEGNALYVSHCAGCHGIDRKGSGSMVPSLITVGGKYSSENIMDILRNGRGRMPSFQSIPDWDKMKIVHFLLETEKLSTQKKSRETAPVTTVAKSDFPYVPPYIRGRGGKFKDSLGYPAIKPPWGTLNAIDLKTGKYMWRVPLGEYPELTKKGIPVTGTENAGGPVVTAAGLVFIAGTEDEKFRAFDARTGKVVWEYQLPAGAFATPVTYMVAGKQYVAIAAGGVRNNHKPGGKYIAFSLP